MVNQDKSLFFVNQPSCPIRQNNRDFWTMDTFFKSFRILNFLNIYKTVYFMAVWFGPAIKLWWNKGWPTYLINYSMTTVFVMQPQALHGLDEQIIYWYISFTNVTFPGRLPHSTLNRRVWIGLFKCDKV